MVRPPRCGRDFCCFIRRRLFQRCRSIFAACPRSGLAYLVSRLIPSRLVNCDLPSPIARACSRQRGATHQVHSLLTRTLFGFRRFLRCWTRRRLCMRYSWLARRALGFRCSFGFGCGLRCSLTRRRLRVSCSRLLGRSRLASRLGRCCLVLVRARCSFFVRCRFVFVRPRCSFLIRCRLVLVRPRRGFFIRSRLVFVRARCGFLIRCRLVLVRSRCSFFIRCSLVLVRAGCGYLVRRCFVFVRARCSCLIRGCFVCSR